jgi:hypothetical protein
VWDARTGQLALALKGHAGQVYSGQMFSVCWSPDGSRLATASYDKTARVWDARTGQEALALRGHGGIVTSVCWSPDGTRLATASFDGTARVWDGRAGRLAPKGFDPWAEDEARRRAWAPDWHLADAAGAVVAGDWFAADFHLGRLLLLRPADPALWRRRADALRHLGKPDLALLHDGCAWLLGWANTLRPPRARGAGAGEP